MLRKIKDGRTDLVIDYLDQGNDANSTDKNGYKLIKWCDYYGDVTAIKYLISKGASIDDLGENYSLNRAAFHGHWRLCQYLLEQGADANHQLPDSGETALHATLSKCNSYVSRLIVKLLLAYGADPNIPTNAGAETGCFMRDARTYGETPLHRAAAFSDGECIKMLLDGGADKTAKDINGDSPMSWASWHSRPGKILSLLAFAEHTIHSLHVERIESDHGSGGSGGMEKNLLGKVHLSGED